MNPYIENLQNIPETLQRLPQWVVWGVPGHPTKCPVNPVTMNRAKAGQPETWGTFEQAAASVRSGQAQGVGFEFHNTGIVGLDLDTIRDPASGKIAECAMQIVRGLNSFTEISQSGYGLHIFCMGDIPLEGNKSKLPPNSIKRPEIDVKTGEVKCDPKTGQPRFKTPEIEIYHQGRYFAMTGDLFVEALPEIPRP